MTYVSGNKLIKKYHSNSQINEIEYQISNKFIIEWFHNSSESVRIRKGYSYKYYSAI